MGAEVLHPAQLNTMIEHATNSALVVLVDTDSPEVTR